MWFWVFMLIMNLLIPVTMIGFGRYFMNGGPKNINGTFGYRTAMSMKNKETWAFAHEYCGKLWYKWGWIILVISVIAMCFFIGKDDDTVGIAGGVICMLQIIPMIGTLGSAERALKENFDEKGNRTSR